MFFTKTSLIPSEQNKEVNDHVRAMDPLFGKLGTISVVDSTYRSC
jgi:hypothetical protein